MLTLRTPESAPRPVPSAPLKYRPQATPPTIAPRVLFPETFVPDEDVDDIDFLMAETGATEADLPEWTTRLRDVYADDECNWRLPGTVIAGCCGRCGNTYSGPVYMEVPSCEECNTILCFACEGPCPCKQ